MAVTCSDIIKFIFAIILPPIGVLLEKERCDRDVIINILLTLLGYLPGNDRRPARASHLLLSQPHIWSLLTVRGLPNES